MDSRSTASPQHVPQTFSSLNASAQFNVNGAGCHAKDSGSPRKGKTEFTKTVARIEGVKEGYIAGYTHADYIYNPHNRRPDRDVERRCGVRPEEKAFFSDTAKPGNDLVAADKDAIVLRTFLKIYGMAEIRAGFAI